MAYLIITLFYLVLLSMFWFMPRQWSLSPKVFLALLLGCVLGLMVYPWRSNSLSAIVLPYINIVGQGYVHLLQMVVTPLISISILSAITKLYNVNHSLGKIASSTIGLLLLTTAIAAIIGSACALFFHLDATQLVISSQENKHLFQLNTDHFTPINALSAPEWILSLIPTNPVKDLAGLRTTSMTGVVISSIFLGLASLEVRASHPESGKKLFALIALVQLWIMKLVKLILSLTPYGVTALVFSIALNAEGKSLKMLASFIITSYLAIIIMLLVHSLLLILARVSPVRFFKKSFSVLAFAFSSRSSAACIPMNINTQTNSLGIPNAIASFVASFGTTIGLNGCAGIYPAMLAVMIAPSVGIDPFNLGWLATLIVITTLSAVGVAGVGGGATFAALIVLTALHLPLSIVALLISVDPIIDMGRTALNVNGMLTVGTLSARMLGLFNWHIFNRETTHLTTEN